MSKLFKIIKRVVFSSFFLYGYNMISQPLNVIIPINILTVGYISLFGVSGLLSLIIIFLFSF